MAEDYQRVFKGSFGSYNGYPKNSNDTILAGLSYFHWLIALVSLVAIQPQSPFLRFHAIQALFLQIASFVLAMTAVILMYFLIGCLLLPFAMILSIYCLVVMIIVITGKDHRVPFLADYVESNYV